MARRGVFPGSFNPMTVAHLEIARLARDAHDLDEVHLVVSTIALDKENPPGPPLARRLELIEAEIGGYDWMRVHVTELRLIAEIAAGYDVVIMGADKWEQVNDERYYSSTADRDAALARLPRVVVATRAGADAPAELRLETPSELHEVSSSAAREGDRRLMAPHAEQHWHPAE